MQNQEIEIAILPDGRIEYTIKGVKGGACESISALLEVLGQVQHEERTGEYYEQPDDAHLTVGHD
jgi:predicted transcriptional regulator